MEDDDVINVETVERRHQGLEPANGSETRCSLYECPFGLELVFTAQTDTAGESRLAYRLWIWHAGGEPIVEADVIFPPPPGADDFTVLILNRGDGRDGAESFASLNTRQLESLQLVMSALAGRAWV